MSGNFLPPNTTRAQLKANWDAYYDWCDWQDGVGKPDYTPVYEVDPEDVLIWKGHTYQMPNPHPADEDKAAALAEVGSDLYRYTLYKLDQERKQDARIAALSAAFGIKQVRVFEPERVKVLAR